MEILKNIGAVIVGLFVGSVVNMALVLVSVYVLWPMPPGTDFSNPEAMAAYIATLPVTALLWVIGAHLGQAFCGGWVAARLATSRPLVLALIIGVLSLIGGVLNMLDLGLPSWMWIEMPFYLVVAGAAGWLEVQRRAR